MAFDWIPTRAWTVVLAAAMLGAPGAAFAQDTDVDDVTQAGEQRADAGAQEQQRVETLANQTDKLLTEYRTVTKVVDGLKVYNNLLQRQVDNQQAEMDALAESIDNVALIERQIVPLMTRMLDSLEQFIALDVPFLMEERTERLERLRDMMERSDVAAAEKFRRVIEAYQIENDYGRTIEAYRGSLEIDGQAREVDFLRIGRVALVYQTVGGGITGGWDKAAGDWAILPPEVYKAAVNTGLRIARKQIAPDLLIAPVPAPTEVGE